MSVSAPDSGPDSGPESVPESVLDDGLVADLVHRARALREHAYAPYSGFHVGAVVVTASGRRFEGVNVENASYRLTTCAEQTALARMCADGACEEVVRVVVAGDGSQPCTPCGACRQTIAEFGPAAVVHATGSDGDAVLTRTIGELLPEAFTPARVAEGEGSSHVGA